MSEFDIEGAVKELREKSHSDIERATAFKWGSRSIAAYKFSEDSENVGESIYWLELGNDFQHEALEHASMTGDSGALLAEMQSILQEHKERALTALLGPDAEEADEDKAEDKAEEAPVQSEEKAEQGPESSEQK